MKLFLVQHALAKAPEEDPERGLTDQGRAETGRVAAFAAAAGVKVDRVLHSPKLRARETAEILAWRLSLGVEPEETDGLLPQDPPEIWAGRAGALTASTMLVGHMPHMEKLAALLTSGDRDKTVVEFRNAGIVCLKKGKAGGWSIAWMIVPDIIS